jgi:SET domain-containing protein
MTIPQITERTNLVFISTSLIPNANLGLFAQRFIPQGSFVCHYNGTVQHLLPGEFPVARGDTSWFSEFFNVVVYGSRSSFGSYSNDPTHDPSLANADIRWDPVSQSASLWAITDIYEDEEILIIYGDDFWTHSTNSGSISSSI